MYSIDIFLSELPEGMVPAKDVANDNKGATHVYVSSFGGHRLNTSQFFNRGEDSFSVRFGRSGRIGTVSSPKGKSPYKWQVSLDGGDVLVFDCIDAIHALEVIKRASAW